MISYFDTHTHLNDAQFDGDRDEVLRSLAESGVQSIVEIADSPADWEKAVSLARARPSQVRCSLGLHPYYAAEYSDAMADALIKKSRLPEVVAVGEIGLDYVKAEVSADIQKTNFLKMLEAARRCALPVVIHCRGAYKDMMPLLRSFYRNGPSPAGSGHGAGRRFRGVLHCFSGAKEDAMQAVELGFALGVDGPITYPKNDALREAVKAAGLDRIVLETDSPYLPPQSARGKRNDPRAIPEIAAKLAEVFGCPLENIARQTTQNARDLYQKNS